MPKLPEKLTASLQNRVKDQSLRQLSPLEDLKDFASNDYLGFSVSSEIFQRTSEILESFEMLRNGAAGSRLLSGNHILYDPAERFIAKFHQAEEALIFNSGYDANIGFFSCVPQRGDLIFYDELVHASVRDGIGMSLARAYKFRHNDLENLQELISINHRRNPGAVIYLVTEAVFSMDGDVPDLKGLSELSEKNGYYLVVDEAHAVGVLGKDGRGAVQELQVQEKVFARIITFGKALGSHGAAVLGSSELRRYLINFARSFIYTTALPPHTVAGILAAYEYLERKAGVSIEKLQSRIDLFNSQVLERGLRESFIPGNSAIRSCLIPGNVRVKQISDELKQEGFDVKAILSPTVPVSGERLRFCLHSYNTEEDIKKLLELLAVLLKKG